MFKKRCTIVYIFHDVFTHRMCSIKILTKKQCTSFWHRKKTVFKVCLKPFSRNWFSLSVQLMLSATESSSFDWLTFFIFSKIFKCKFKHFPSSINNALCPKKATRVDESIIITFVEVLELQLSKVYCSSFNQLYI